MLTMLGGKELSRFRARKVRSYSRIRGDAEEMTRMVDGGWVGRDYRAAHALAHAQVSREPFAFFVASRDLRDGYALAHQVIVNPVILWRPKMITVTVGGVRLKGVANEGPLPEGCLTFPHRRAVPVSRFLRVLVMYWYPGPLGVLLPAVQYLRNLPAQVFQHECDHIKGKNIFFE